MIDIRPCSPADLDSLLVLTDEMQRFYGEVIEGDDEVRREQLRAALGGGLIPISHVLLAWRTRRCVGFASYSVLWPAVGLTGSLYVKELFVSSDARREGVGTVLMEKLYGLARDNNLTRVEWTTEPTNEEALSFYTSLGARPLKSKSLFRVSL